MQCLDDLSQLNLLNKISVDQGNILMISLTECKGQPHCKSEVEIAKFIESHRLYI
jgi:hypothetical protein